MSILLFQKYMNKDEGGRDARGRHSSVSCSCARIACLHYADEERKSNETEVLEDLDLIFFSEHVVQVQGIQDA